LGVGLVVDQFGRGDANLLRLRRLPFSGLILDRQLVGRLGDDAQVDEVCRGMLGMARALGLEVLADGVVQGAQVKALHQMGCARMQGAWLAQPMTVADFEAWLAEH
jgi:diguanylate cyclase